MANDTDTDTLAGAQQEPFPTGGALGGAQAPAVMPIPAQAQPASPAPSPLAGVDQLLAQGLGGMQQPVGPQIQQQHGGLLTGLAGLLLQGLASGMAPTAREAYEMPMRMQQQATQQQQLQMQQQKMQEEMATEPIRIRAMQAQTLMNIMQATHMIRGMSDQLQLGFSDAQMKANDAAVEDGRAREVGETSDYNAAQQKYKELTSANRNTALHYGMDITGRDAQGNPNKYRIFQYYPDKTLQQDEYIDLPGYGNIPAIHEKVNAGTSEDDKRARESHLAVEQAAAIRMAADIKNPEEGYARAIEAARAAGKDPAKDPAVQQWQTAIQATKTPTFDEMGYQQFVQGTAKNPPHPGASVLDYLKAKPQMQLSLAEAQPPPLSEIVRRTRAGNQYLSSDDVTGKPGAQLRREAAAQGIPIVSKDVAGTLEDIDAAKANQEYMLQVLGPKLASGPLSRPGVAAKLTLEKAAQTDPELAAMGSFFPVAIQSLRAIAGSKGFRMTQAEINMAVANDMPKMTDTLAVAQTKLRNLEAFLGNTERAHLRLGTGGGATAAVTTGQTAPEGTVIQVGGRNMVKRGGQWVAQ